MGLQFVVGGTTRTSNARINTLSITSTIKARSSFAELTMHSSAPATWRPKAGNEIIISTTSDAVVHFGGMVERVTETPTNPVEADYFLDCKDYTWLFDRRMVTTAYDTSSGAAILADIVNTYTTGFSTSGIQNLGNIPAQRFDYVYPSEAFTAIANQQQAHWYVDYSKAVQYLSVISDVAPTTAIVLDSNVADYGQLVLTEDASNIRNRVIMQGYKVATSVKFAQTFLGDSTTRFFFLGYEPVDLTSANMTVTAAGAAVDLLTDVVDAAPGTTAGASSQVFVCFSNMGIRWSTGAAAPSSNIVATFNYLKDGGIQYDDPAAQTEMASRSSGDGVHMFVVNDPGLTNRASNDDLANYAAQSVAKHYGKPVISGTFTSYTQGWRGGQYLTCASTWRMGGFSKTFYVHQATKKIVRHPSGGSPTWVYEVSISDNELVI